MECTAIGGPVTITDLEWTAPAPPTMRPAAIAICTFNSADDCATNVAAVAGDKGLLAGIDAIYVVDQGADAVETRPLFNEVAAQLGDKLVYLRQPNLGGAGGFSRGMYEISSVADHANVILMDDDILCEPETILRLNAFANLTPSPTIVGAQMLYLKNTRELHVGAEQTQLTSLRAGRWAPRALHKSDMTKYKQHKRIDAEYNAWWSCLIPSEVIAAVGLRCRCSSSGTTSNTGCVPATRIPDGTLPNAGLARRFDWKDRDEFFRYFSVRNSLIAHALHGTIDAKTTGNWLAREITEGLVSMQYGMAYTMIRGIEDFLAGPECCATAALPRWPQSARSARSTPKPSCIPRSRSANSPARSRESSRAATCLARKDQPGARQALGVPMARAHHPRTGRHRGRRQPVVARLAVRPGGGDGRLAVRCPDTTSRQRS